MKKSQTRCAFSLNCVQLALTLNNLGASQQFKLKKPCFFFELSSTCTNFAVRKLINTVRII